LFVFRRLKIGPAALGLGMFGDWNESEVFICIQRKTFSDQSFPLPQRYRNNRACIVTVLILHENQNFGD
jgi:hypothetical protein